MPTVALPETSANIVSAATRSFQVPVVVANASFTGVPDTSLVASGTSFSTRQLSHVRCQLFHYPFYRTYPLSVAGAVQSSWVARPWLMYRILGAATPYAPPILPGSINTMSAFTPITPQRLLPVGVPVELNFSGLGFDLVWVEFDTTAGTAGTNQGIDQILVTFTGAGT